MRTNSYTLIFTLTILLGVYFNVAASQHKHEYNHDDLAKLYKPVVVQPTPEEDFERNLKQKQPRNMIITYDLVNYDTLPEEELYFMKMVDRSLKVAIKYFHDLIMIIPKDRKYSRFEEESWINGENRKCYEAQITPEQQAVERDTDLHLYITYSYNATISTVASAVNCRMVDGLGPSHGGVDINKAKFSKSHNENGHSQEDIIEVLTHEILHILGFSGYQVYYDWVDQNKQKYQYPVTYMDWKGQYTGFLSTPNVLAFARKHFNCDSIPGMPIDSPQSNKKDVVESKYFGHWKDFTTLNEMMNPYTVSTQAVITNFTASLLRDTGYYYSINEKLIDYTTYGKDAGCHFFWGHCDAARYPEICSPQEDDNLCDFYHEGRSECSQSPDNCNIAYVKPEHRCYEEKNKHNNDLEKQKYGTKFGSNTKCFNSNLIASDLASGQEQMKGQCYQFKCNDAHQVIVQIGKTKVTCSRNNQEIRKVPGFDGVLRCPENLENFCGMKKFCPKACLGRGYCKNGECHCIDGWTGKTCSQKINQKPRQFTL